MFVFEIEKNNRFCNIFLRKTIFELKNEKELISEDTEL